MASCPGQAAGIGLERSVQSRHPGQTCFARDGSLTAARDGAGAGLAFNHRDEDGICARNIVEWCHDQVTPPVEWPERKSKPPWVIPDINPRLGPFKDQAPDPRYWPSMKRDYPNPVQASRGQDALLPKHFHLAAKIVYFVYWPFFFGELVPIIKCPKCGLVDRVTSDGWTGVSDKIRHVCAADGPAFIYSHGVQLWKSQEGRRRLPG
jgi:hypothetical protein